MEGFSASGWSYVGNDNGADINDELCFGACSSTYRVSGLVQRDLY